MQVKSINCYLKNWINVRDSSYLDLSVCLFLPFDRLCLTALAMDVVLATTEHMKILPEHQQHEE